MSPKAAKQEKDEPEQPIIDQDIVEILSVSDRRPSQVSVDEETLPPLETEPTPPTPGKPDADKAAAASSSTTTAPPKKKVLKNQHQTKHVKI